ncbi:unnamed protein product [Schistosoma rodhaini]|uniref:Conserved oligomeric Golgi complex subunit 2 n=2 Tax=Schistosoma mansoni TaxID=6183 RepID=A0A5K4F5Z1_SCHMA|nr:unnamed protein product [Schistosoma rodhaini]
MTLTKRLLEGLDDSIDERGFSVIEDEDFQAAVSNHLFDASNLVSNELTLISNIVKSDISKSSYYHGSSELYQLLDLLIRSFENIVSKHDDLIKYLVTIDKEESYLPISLTSHKKAVETIMSLDFCLTSQSSATSTFDPRERLMELVLDSKNNIDKLTSFNQNLCLLACQLNEASNLLNDEMD